MEDYDTNLDIYEILEVNDEIELEMLNFTIEGIEISILKEELEKSIWNAYFEGEPIPTVLREYELFLEIIKPR